MAKINLILDTRRANANNEYPVKLQICTTGKTAYISTGVSVSKKNWQGEVSEAINPKCKNAKADNQYLFDVYAKYVAAMRKISTQNMTASEIKKTIEKELFPEQEKETFTSYAGEFVNSRQADKTKETYKYTLTEL